MRVGLLLLLYFFSLVHNSHFNRASHCCSISSVPISLRSACALFQIWSPSKPQSIQLSKTVLLLLRCEFILRLFYDLRAKIEIIELLRHLLRRRCILKERGISESSECWILSSQCFFASFLLFFFFLLLLQHSEMRRKVAFRLWLHLIFEDNLWLRRCTFLRNTY